MNQKPKFSIRYYQDAWDFLMRMDQKSRKKIADTTEKARVSLDPKVFKKLTGEVWEFRTLYHGKQYRLLAFWDKRDHTDTLVVATHGFVKKVGKIPGKEIEKAKQIMKLYYSEIK